MTVKSRRVLFHFFVTIVFIVFLFYSIKQKNIEMLLYDVAIYIIISLGSYIRYKKTGNNTVTKK